MKWVVPALLVVALSRPGVVLARATQPESEKCDMWSIKGVHIGMSLEKVRAKHEKLKRSKNHLRPDNRGRGWYLWAESRMKGLYNYVLPETDNPSAAIISVVVTLDVSESSTSSLIEALSERWGQPNALQVPLANARYFSAFGTPRGEFEWTATTWEDASCDVLATLVDKTKVPPVRGAPPFKEISLYLDSISMLIAKREAELEKAREAVRP